MTNQNLLQDNMKQDDLDTTINKKAHLQSIKFLVILLCIPILSACLVLIASFIRSIFAEEELLKLAPYIAFGVLFVVIGFFLFFLYISVYGTIKNNF